MTRDETIHNEQVKLWAAWMNSASVAFLVTGLLAPVIGSLVLTEAPHISGLAVAAFVFSGGACFALRIEASSELERLISDEQS